MRVAAVAQARVEAAQIRAAADRYAAETRAKADDAKAAIKAQAKELLNYCEAEMARMAQPWPLP